MIKEFMDKLNDVEGSGVDLGVMEINKGKKEKAPKAESESNEESEEGSEEDEGSEDDIKTEIFKKALEMAGYESDDEAVEALISDLASNGMEIEIGEDADKDEIVKTLSDYISGIENDDEEESEENKEHEDSETAEEEKEEHMEESAKTNKKIIKENTMEFGVSQLDKLSRSLGMMSGILDSMKDGKEKDKMSKIFSDLDSIVSDLSGAEASEEAAMEMPTDEELPVEPEAVTEPSDDEVSMEPEATEEIPAVEPEDEEEAAPVATESVRHKKSTIAESASAYLSKLDWITD